MAWDQLIRQLVIKTMLRGGFYLVLTVELILRNTVYSNTSKAFPNRSNLRIRYWTPDRAGNNTKEHFSHAKYESTDIMALPGIEHDFLCSLDNIPKLDNCYDVVLCTQVLEHVEYPQAVVHELFRILKQGGIYMFPLRNPRVSTTNLTTTTTSQDTDWPRCLTMQVLILCT